jgi:sugar phosphate isomerase/epimerase
MIDRRTLLKTSAAALVAAASRDAFSASAAGEFRLKYILASCMYGYFDLATILPEVAKVGATAIDIWPMKHGNQREQLDELGEEKFAALLKQHQVGLGCITQFKLGPFGLENELKLAQRLGCKTIVTGAVGPKDAKGTELKKAVADFIEKLKPHLAIAEESGVTISIENHANNLIDSPDSMKYLAELRPSKNLSIAFAPYHLPQDEKLLCDLIRALGDSISVFYAWEHGNGCMNAMPKEEELLQMPGRGKLDFAPLIRTLKEIRYEGWTEIFMHPFPRGIPILETTDEVTREINRARSYLESH